MHGPQRKAYDEAIAFLREEEANFVELAPEETQLLRDMAELVPGVLELEITELIAGLRPATPDNLPAIGLGARDGLLWATGHYRNGIVLAPVTADAIAAVLTGEGLPAWATAADPRRFAGVPA